MLKHNLVKEDFFILYNKLSEAKGVIQPNLFNVRHDNAPILNRPLDVNSFLDRISSLIRLDAFRPMWRQILSELLIVIDLDSRRPDAVCSTDDESEDSVDQNVDAHFGRRRRRWRRRCRVRRRKGLTSEVQFFASQLGRRFFSLLLGIVLRRVSLDREIQNNNV